MPNYGYPGSGIDPRTFMSQTTARPNAPTTSLEQLQNALEAVAARRAQELQGGLASRSVHSIQINPDGSPVLPQVPFGGGPPGAEQTAMEQRMGRPAPNTGSLFGGGNPGGGGGFGSANMIGNQSGSMRTTGQAGNVALPQGVVPQSVLRAYEQMAAMSPMSGFGAQGGPAVRVPSANGSIPGPRYVAGKDASQLNTTDLAYAGDAGTPAPLAAINNAAGMPPLPRIRPTPPGVMPVDNSVPLNMPQPGRASITVNGGRGLMAPAPKQQVQLLTLASGKKIAPGTYADKKTGMDYIVSSGEKGKAIVTPQRMGNAYFKREMNAPTIAGGLLRTGLPKGMAAPAPASKSKPTAAQTKAAARAAFLQSWNSG